MPRNKSRNRRSGKKQPKKQERKGEAATVAPRQQQAGGKGQTSGGKDAPGDKPAWWKRRPVWMTAVAVLTVVVLGMSGLADMWIAFLTSRDKAPELLLRDTLARIDHNGSLYIDVAYKNFGGSTAHSVWCQQHFLFDGVRRTWDEVPPTTTDARPVTVPSEQIVRKESWLRRENRDFANILNGKVQFRLVGFCDYEDASGTEHRLDLVQEFRPYDRSFLVVESTSR